MTNSEFTGIVTQAELGKSETFPKADVIMLTREINRLRKALKKIASFDDKGANEYLADTGRFSRFDEPDSARMARKALEWSSEDV